MKKVNGATNGPDAYQKLMRAGTRLGACLALAAILVQPGCNKGTGSSQDAVAPGKAGDARSSSGDANRTGRPRGNTVTLPEGTQLAVRTTTTLSTKTQLTGQTFTAHLQQPMVFDGREIAPKGAEVEGQIVDADKGGRVKDRASLSVRLTRLQTARGDVEITTNTITREAKATKTKDAVKVGIGSGVGAAIGAIAGGGKGAAIGAAAGAGAGTGVVLATRGDPAVIPSETVLHFELRAPVTLAASR